MKLTGGTFSSREWLCRSSQRRPLEPEPGEHQLPQGWWVDYPPRGPEPSTWLGYPVPPGPSSSTARCCHCWVPQAAHRQGCPHNCSVSAKGKVWMQSCPGDP